MYEIYPYITNDGTVGLFSTLDDDIYHSTYGALTESWQKFIIPSKLDEFIRQNKSVKILDICYGIGYNTKTALQVFVNILNKQKKKNIKNSKKIRNTESSIEAIYTDNTTKEHNRNLLNNFCKKSENQIKIESANLNNIETIHSDNIQDDSKYKFLVDAVDLDKNLINLSPFIINGRKDNLFMKKYIYLKYYKNSINKNKLLQIQKIKKLKMQPIKNKYKLSNEVSIIILENLLKNNNRILNDIILKNIMSKKNYSIFFSKYMLNFAKFCSNQTYKTNQKFNLSTFLHNIYYRNISKSYKNAKMMQEFADISLNLVHNDARKFIKESSNIYDFIFLDAFTPAKCPSLWTLQFFKELYSRLNYNGMILTYSNSASVRNAFIQNGFYIGKIYDEKLNKFIGTVAVKNKDLIEHELNEKDWAVINSKAGICYQDKDLNLSNESIIKNRELDVEESTLISSSKALKGL